MGRREHPGRIQGHSISPFLDHIPLHELLYRGVQREARVEPLLLSLSLSLARSLSRPPLDPLQEGRMHESFSKLTSLSSAPSTIGTPVGGNLISKHL